MVDVDSNLEDIVKLANEINGKCLNIQKLIIRKDVEIIKTKNDLLLSALKVFVISLVIGSTIWSMIFFDYWIPAWMKSGAIILLFGIAAIILEMIVVLFQEAIWNPGDCVRLVGLTVIVTFVVYLAVGYSDLGASQNLNSFTAIIGFLGTIAGYLAGSMGKPSPN